MGLHRVHNLREGNRPVPAGYSSWIDYWEKATGLKAGNCHNVNCNAKATDGGHVQLDFGSDKWYIVPLCHWCNTQFGMHFTAEGPLVSATNPMDILW